VLTVTTENMSFAAFLIVYVV